MVDRAGGVIWRSGRDGDTEVVLVHRPRDDGWSLPKGKLRSGEPARAAARREVLEETGFACEAGPLVADVSYLDSKGRPTRARFWAMRVAGGAFAENDEVDAIEWVPLDDAPVAVCRDLDRDVLARFGDVVVRVV